MPLTHKQREFCRHYAKNPSAPKAALAAGYSGTYANSKAGKLLENEDVISEIQRLRSRMNERAEKSATDVVNEYSKIAFVDRTSFLKDDPWHEGRVMYKSPDELTAEQKSIVERVALVNRKHKIDGEDRWRQEYTYTLSDKANALQQMGRHFGIFDDKLRLQSGGANPFANASPEQLEKLKASFVGIMSGEAIDGQFTEVKNPNLLPDGKRRTGTG